MGENSVLIGMRKAFSIRRSKRIKDFGESMN